MTPPLASNRSCPLEAPVAGYGERTAPARFESCVTNGAARIRRSAGGCAGFARFGADHLLPRGARKIRTPFQAAVRGPCGRAFSLRRNDEHDRRGADRSAAVGG